MQRFFPSYKYGSELATRSSSSSLMEEEPKLGSWTPCWALRSAIRCCSSSSSSTENTSCGFCCCWLLLLLHAAATSRLTCSFRLLAANSSTTFLSFVAAGLVAAAVSAEAASAAAFGSAAAASVSAGATSAFGCGCSPTEPLGLGIFLRSARFGAGASGC